MNVGMNLSETECAAVKEISKNPKITATELAASLSVSKRQAERVFAALKRKAGLRREGARCNGSWRFENAE